MLPARHPMPPYATAAYLGIATDPDIGPPWTPSSGYQPHQRRGAWPAIVSGNRQPDSHPSQGATITRPEGHLHYPAERENLATATITQ